VKVQIVEAQSDKSPSHDKKITKNEYFEVTNKNAKKRRIFFFGKK
jgi:hypothetical protein